MGPGVRTGEVGLIHFEGKDSSLPSGLDVGCEGEKGAKAEGQHVGLGAGGMEKPCTGTGKRWRWFSMCVWHQECASACVETPLRPASGNPSLSASVPRL